MVFGSTFLKGVMVFGSTFLKGVMVFGSTFLKGVMDYISIKSINLNNDLFVKLL
jgi:hypothetical protein